MIVDKERDAEKKKKFKLGPASKFFVKILVPNEKEKHFIDLLKCFILGSEKG